MYIFTQIIFWSTIVTILGINFWKDIFGLTSWGAIYVHKRTRTIDTFFSRLVRNGMSRRTSIKIWIWSVILTITLVGLYALFKKYLGPFYYMAYIVVVLIEGWICRQWFITMIKIHTKISYWLANYES